MQLFFLKKSTLIFW